VKLWSLDSDEHSEIPPLPVLRTGLNGVFGKN
jgi:hypothetical protein